MGTGMGMSIVWRRLQGRKFCLTSEDLGVDAPLVVNPAKTRRSEED
jgi:hypothetical protein